VHGSSPEHREVRAGKLVYATSLLLDYRERFMKLMGASEAEIIPVPGIGLDLHRREMPVREVAASRRISPPPLPDAPAVGWREFLSGYARGMRQLHAFSKDCSGSARELWETVLPVAARVVKEGFRPGPDAMEEARRWSLERIHRVLQPAD
jgi:hypothetical protein